MAKRATLSVAHATDTYFHLSENWVHTQIVHLERYSPLVLTRRTANLDGRVDVRPYYACVERPRLELLLNKAGEKLWGFCPTYYWKLRRHRARVIHAHFGDVGFAMLPLAKQADIPLVTSFYGYDLSLLPRRDPAWNVKYRQLFREGARFLVEGPHMKWQLAELGCPEHKISVQHLGIDRSEFPYVKRAMRINEPLRVLFAGRFAEKKGIVYAVKAFTQFLTRGGEGVLTIIGDANENKPAEVSAKREILNTIEASRAASRVALRGMQPYPQLKKAYYDNHVFLSPSVQATDGDNEGGAPVTTIEASATGMPVVATWHCDIPEVVRHNKTGYLARERDVDTLAENLMKLYRNPELLAEFGSAAYEHIGAAYDARLQAERLEDIYDDVCSRSSKDNLA